MLAFDLASTADIPLLRTMAHDIWHAHYPGIITTAQIDYMLDRFFAEESLRADMATGVIWEMARLNGAPVGFLSCSPGNPQGRLKLSKLYLRPEFHGRGLGQAMLNRVSAIAREQDAGEIFLTVNKRNSKAIRAYQRAGYTIARELVADIGAGYVMDDYEMILRCPSAPDASP